MTPQKVSVKAVRLLFVERSSSPSATDIKLASLDLNVETVYLLPFKITIDNKLRCSHFRIIHNIIPSSLRL